MATMTTAVIKTIRSYNGLARFLAECDQDEDGCALIVRETPRRDDIPSPFACSPEMSVHRWRGRDVIVSEVSHRCYQVFDATGS